MIQWVIYRNPSDHPGKYVVRRWTIGRGEVTPDPEPAAVVDTLERARAEVPVELGLVRLPRTQWDDPVIAEVWL